MATQRTLLRFLGCMMAASAAAVPVAAQDTTRPLDLATFPRTELEITSHGNDRAAHTYSFQVWIADTEARAQQGLMFVNDLPETMGMLFPMQPPRVATFWMKNTYIELDMLFIDGNGRVRKIIERAPPLSLQTQSSDTPVTAVLELKGGQAAKLGLRVGDTVTWKKAAA